MSKSVKLKDNNYWDSEGIAHNRGTLKDKLDSIDTNISNNTSRLNTLSNDVSGISTNLNNVIGRIAGYGEQAKNINDPNNLGLASGFYRYYGNFGGKTATSWWFIIHIAHYDSAGNFARQIVCNYFGTQIKTRIQTTGSWGNFVDIVG